MKILLAFALLAVPVLADSRSMREYRRQIMAEAHRARIEAYRDAARVRRDVMRAAAEVRRDAYREAARARVEARRMRDDMRREMRERWRSGREWRF